MLGVCVRNAIGECGRVDIADEARRAVSCIIVRKTPCQRASIVEFESAEITCVTLIATILLALCQIARSVSHSRTIAANGVNSSSLSGGLVERKSVFRRTGTIVLHDE